MLLTRSLLLRAAIIAGGALWQSVSICVDELDAQKRFATEVCVWPAQKPFPNARSLSAPTGIKHIRIHEAMTGDSGDFGWLLGAAIVEHKGTLYASWGNCRRHENSPDAHMRGRKSTDSGETWSSPFIIAQLVEGEGRHAHGSFLSKNGCLYAFVSFHHGQGHKQLKTRLFVLDEEADQWTFENDLIPGFYPMDRPQKLGNGNWIMGGFDRDMRGAVAISDGDDVTKPWRVRTISDVPRGFETSIWVNGMTVTAFIRQWKESDEGIVYLATVRSSDGGEHWELARKVEVPTSGLPFTDSKVYAGTLSTGQRYLVFNTPVDGDHKNRNALCLAVTKPGESTFSRVFAVRTFGQTAPRTDGQYKNDGWQYPYAHEYDGKLHIVYARAKEDCELSVIPLSSLSSNSAKRKSTGGTVYQVHYPNGTSAEQLQLSVDYYLWVPDGVETLRGIVVHQHGCGPGASRGGRTAADDLHWQALARKQKCALMGSSYFADESTNCRLWCDARRGSSERFLQAIDHFAAATEHSELSSAPWCLWGHSGGAFWASLMQTIYPKRIVAIWLQSGTAFDRWKRGEIEAPVVSKQAYAVPVLTCPGIQEQDKAVKNGKAMCDEYRAQGAPFFEIAVDPRTGHECGDSRYLAIPFFDFWLGNRLPNTGKKLVPVSAGVLAEWSAQMADKQAEFIRTGAVSDTTAPPPPTDVAATRRSDGSVHLKWSATADLESGIREFIILRDGKTIGRVPERSVGRFGRPLFQGMTYHDTPDAGAAKMEFIDRDATPDRLPTYGIQTVNSAKLISTATSSR